MNRKILRGLTALSILTLAVACSQPALPDLMHSVWKFQKGDSPEFARISFDDSGWDTISPGVLWEDQGYAGYDGFAWYRVRFTVPASLRRQAESYGGMLLRLARIDDADVTFLNGSEIGSTGSMPPDYRGEYDKLREYVIPAQDVNWGGENLLAVRVYDNGGGGGIWDGAVELSAKGPADLVVITPAFTEHDRILKKSDAPVIPVALYGELKKQFRGTLSLLIKSDFGDTVSLSEQQVMIDPGDTTIYSFALNDVIPGFYNVTATVSGGMVSKHADFSFGYEPEQIVSPVDTQPDFSLFWSMARKELAGVKPEFRMIKIDSLCTDSHNMYLVEMRSLGNALIRGWYCVPVRAGRYPAVMQVPGYSSVMQPSYVNYGDDIIGFGLNIRGHGNSTDDVNPGFPGYILSGIEDKNSYIYRGAYMDCIRGIDFLFSRPEVDKKRVAVDGASQGGALTFATAALDNERIAVCTPQVPFLSDFPDYFRVAEWPGNEFRNYVEVEKKQTWEEVFRTLSYFDIKNLAPGIKAPLFMGVGLIDKTCPPHINFAAYNQVSAEKAYVAYPESGHGLPDEHYRAKMAWIRSHFGMN